MNSKQTAVGYLSSYELIQFDVHPFKGLSVLIFTCRFDSVCQRVISSSGSSSNTRLDEKAEQEATGFLLDLVSVSRDNGLKLPRGTVLLFLVLMPSPPPRRFRVV